MSLLKAHDQEALRQEFAQMSGRVRLVFFTQALGCETCGITAQILGEVVPLGEKIELVTLNYAIDRDAVQKYAIRRIPAIAVIRLEEAMKEDGETELRERDYGIRFYGVPSGYEFMSLIGAILDVSSGDSQLSPDSRALLAQLTQPAHLQVFTTPT
jgi:alkyl hydroperoxide reductase subunit AhpF